MSGKESDFDCSWESYNFTDVLENSTIQTLKPISWLFGKWNSIKAEGINPKPFLYKEQLEFAFAGQPLLIYRAKSWSPETNKPMHFESGFLRIKPNTNNISFVTSHNFGLTMIEEGVVENNKMSLISKNISRMAFAKEPAVTEIKRTYTIMDDGNLKVNTDMGTENYPLKNHLIAIYQKKS